MRPYTPGRRRTWSPGARARGRDRLALDARAAAGGPRVVPAGPDLEPGPQEEHRIKQLKKKAKEALIAGAGDGARGLV